jgi:hypothetical protein
LFFQCSLLPFSSSSCPVSVQIVAKGD